MKSRMLVMLSSLALLTTGAALAQNMKANIPFEFRVGAALLPAGHYDIRVGEINGVVMLRNGHDSVMATTYAGAKTKPDTSKLVFKKYGRSYFLSSVCTPGTPSGRELSAPKVKSEWAFNGAPDAIVEVTLATR